MYLNLQAILRKLLSLGPQFFFFCFQEFAGIALFAGVRLKRRSGGLMVSERGRTGREWMPWESANNDPTGAMSCSRSHVFM